MKCLLTKAFAATGFAWFISKKMLCSEPVTGRASTIRRVERKKPRFNFRIRKTVVRTSKLCRHERVLVPHYHAHEPFRLAKRTLNRLSQTLTHTLCVVTKFRDKKLIYQYVDVVFFLLRENDLLTKVLLFSIDACLRISLAQIIIKQLVIFTFSPANKRGINAHLES